MVLVTTIVVLIIIFTAPTAWAQKTSFSIYRQPARVDLYDNAPRADTGKTYASCMYTEFYPIGWSRQGEFAYFTFFDDYDASGMAWLNLYIFDAKKDTIVAQLAPEKEYWTETLVDTIWHENKQFFTKLLDSFGIVQQKTILSKFPIVLKNDTGTFKFLCRTDTSWVEAEDSPYGFPCFDTLVIRLHAEKGGFEKVIYNGSGYVAFGYSIPGFIKDPFDSSLFFIPLVLTHWGWEGPPHTTSIAPIGVVLE